MKRKKPKQVNRDIQMSELEKFEQEIIESIRKHDLLMESSFKFPEIEIESSFLFPLDNVN